MPRLNLFLNADVALDTVQILFNQSLLAPEPTLGTKAQRKALHCILSNVGKYKSQPLLYSIKNHHLQRLSSPERSKAAGQKEEAGRRTLLCY